jgi:hypothetical protein
MTDIYDSAPKIKVVNQSVITPGQIAPLTPGDRPKEFATFFDTLANKVVKEGSPPGKWSTVSYWIIGFIILLLTLLVFALIYYSFSSSSSVKSYRYF